MASHEADGDPGVTPRQKGERFWGHINEQLDELSHAISVAQDGADLDVLGPRLAKLRSELTDMTPLLPAHDCKVHEARLLEVTRQLQERKAKLQPKPGFSFRRKAQPVGAAAALPPASRGGPNVRVSDSTSPDEGSSSTTQPPPHLGKGHAVLGPCSHRSLTWADVRPPNDAAATVSSLSSSSSPPPSCSSLSDLHLLGLDDCRTDLRSTPLGSHGAAAKGGAGASSPRPSVARLGAVQVRDVRRSVLLLGDVDGSVMLHDVHDCAVVVSCRQFRMHRSSRCVLLLSTASAVTLEHCTRLLIHLIQGSRGRGVDFVTAEGPVASHEAEAVPTEAAASHTTATPHTAASAALRVQDFDHVDPRSPSPNWRRISPGSSAFNALEAHLLLQPSMPPNGATLLPTGSEPRADREVCTTATTATTGEGAAELCERLWQTADQSKEAAW